ncbi:MAG: phosphatase PAP2 family protein [Bacteroidaceae bacterium]|nr:phosphatase PAP2 family protein [Bacteroidaceae bacterium]
MMANKPQMVLPVDMNITTSQFNKNRLHHTFSLAVPVAAVGFAIMPADHAIRNRVVNGMSGFHTSVDDYIRFVPLATQLALSLGGVQGRSKNRWQVLVTDAMATAMMATMVYGMKYGIDRTRPNGERGSFPSGHTATAFMGATLLAHEYGHKSVWIPIAGYSVATATGVLRILNNKHYASDVLVGAAIGIVSAELAYWATDAIFNDRKLFKSRRARIHYEVLKNY